jgi:hypothetical protein
MEQNFGATIRINDILAAMQNAVTAINGLNKTLQTLFPPITAPTSVAPATGAVTYNSSQVSAFGLVQTSSGGVFRIALLPSS